MNKIYKVIWSKAKHTYVVASEIAKGHTKGETTGRGLKRLAAAMLVAAALLSPSFAWAADTVTVNDTSTVQQTVYTKDGADNTFVKKGSDNGNSLTIGASDSTKSFSHQYKTGAQTIYDGEKGQVVTQATGDKSSISLKVGNADDLNYNFQDYSEVTTTRDGGTTFTYHYKDGAQTIDDNNTTIKGNTVTTGRVTASNGVVDGTTTEGVSVKKTNTVGQNLSALDDRITAVKDYVLNETGKNYVSKTDAAVQDGAIVKADKTIGENVTNLDAALAKETAARIGADKAQDAVIQQVNQNAANGIATLATAYNNEVASREAADTAINNKLAQDKTDTALHVTKDGNLIVGTKENQTVKDVKIRGQLTSGSVSTGNITATGDAKVAGKVEAEAVYDDTTKPGNYVVQTNSVGSNLSVLDTQVKANADAVATKANAADVYTKTETDSKVDAVKKEATIYTYRKVAAEEAARKAADNELNERITNEANAIHETTNQLQSDLSEEAKTRESKDNELNERITNEANAIHDEIKAGDTALDNRITAVKESLQQEAADTYVSKADAAVQDGAIVKADKTIGENVTNLDAALAKETAARLGADKAQDEVIQQVNQNMVDGFNTINKNMFDGFTALNQADANELAGRVAADTKLVEAVNSGVSLSDDNVLQKNTTSIDAQGNVTTSKTDANEMILNKGKDNQITLNDKGIKVGTNSSVMDKDGVYTGGDTYSEAKAALKSDGQIKGANGKFTVDASGNTTVTSLDAGTGTIQTKGDLYAKDATFSGDITAKDATLSGDLSAKDGTFSGDLSAKDGTFSGDVSAKDVTATGTLQGAEVTDGTATLKQGKLTGAKDIETEALHVNGNANVTGKLTTKDLEVTGEFNANTLKSRLDENNYTEIHGGNVTSKNLKVDKGVTRTSESSFDENGREEYVTDNDSRATVKVGANEISQTLDDKGDNPEKAASRVLSQNTNNKYEITDSVVEGNQSNVENRTADTTDSQISFKDDSGKVLNKSYITQNLKKVLMGVEEGDNKTTIEQDANNITNTAKNGTIKNDAKDLVNTATGNMTNTVGGKLLNDVTGDMENKVGGNLTTTVGGSQTTTVTGDSSLTAENINNTATNKITNKALDVETDASSSIVNKVSNDYGSNTSTQLSYETKEEMSQADGKIASYLRGAAEEKSQLIDGAKKTTIDTVAGQTNTNITDGTNTSNDLQKADQIASSVTDGTNTTVVNQDAKSLASSITDGTKANNTNSTVDKSEQLIKASDTQYSATTKTASKTEDALVSGSSVIDVIKNLDDAANPFIGSAVTDGTNSTGITQTAKDITNTAEKGTIANNAKDITNNATENMTNTVGKDLTTTVGGEMKTTVTGKVTEDYKSDLDTKVGGNETHYVAGSQTNTVSGDRTVNVKGTETENFNAQVTNVKTDQRTSVGGNQTNIVAGNQQNTVSGSKTETVKGSVTEKYGSQATTVDGDQSTHVGGNQSNVVAGNQTNTISGNKTETVKGAVSETYGSQSTTVNGNQSNTVKGTLTETVTGDVTEDYKANLSTKVGGNQTTTVTGDSSLSAKNITNTASEKITNQIGDGSAVKSEMTADGITNTAEGGTIYNKSEDILNEVSGDILNFADGEIGNSATKITNLTGDNTVTSDTNGTTFENKAHNTAVKEGTVTKTTISGNTITTGEAVMDYADVMKDLGVRGNATVDGNTTLGTDGNDTLTVNSTSTVKEKVTMENDLNVKNEVLVNGGDKNQVRINKNGITVGLNSTVVDSDGVYVGGHTFEAAKAGMDIDGKLKAASGNFQVDTKGNVSAVSYTVKDTNIKIDNTGINAGGTKVTGLAPADISHAGSTDAVSGGQLYETNTRVSGLETRMGTVETRVDKLDNKIDKVGANAAAMANLHPLEFDEDSKWNVAAAVGSSGSETASAVGVFYRPNENVMVNASAAMGTGENMFGGGVSLRLGHGGNKAKEAQMKAAAAENKELRAKVDDLTARMDALLSVLNPNMSKDFPDVPENHWAYEAVSRLAGNGIVEGYEDGKYHGERQMTRYEMAEIIYNALSKGAKAEKKLVEEFRPELQAMAAQKKA